MTGTEYAKSVRDIIDGALGKLCHDLSQLEQMTDAVIQREGGDIGPSIYSLAEAYRKPSLFTVTTLVQCLDAFLKMRGVRV